MATVEWLWSHGINIDAQKKRVNTRALHWAASEGHQSMVVVVASVELEVLLYGAAMVDATSGSAGQVDGWHAALQHFVNI